MIRALAALAAEAWATTGWVEITAAALAVAYLVLAIRQHIICWAAAFVSSCLYVWVMFRAHLYMESGLNVFYAAMALYGFLQWRPGGGRPLEVSSWPLARHVVGLAAVIAMSTLTSFFLRRHTAAAWPFIDSMTAWSSVFATFLVARKVYENWHWWLLIDSVNLWLCYVRGLYLTVLLFALYLAMILVGLREWRRGAAAVRHAPVLERA